MTNNYRLLILDDDVSWQNQHGKHFESRGFEYFRTSWAKEAIELCSTIRDIRYAIIDEVLSVSDEAQPVGTAVIRRIREEREKERLPPIRFVLVTEVVTSSSTLSDGAQLADRADQPDLYIVPKDTICQDKNLAYGKIEKFFKEKILLEESTKLQAIFEPQAVQHDMGFIRQASIYCQSICQVIIEEPGGATYGTGFLIAPDLVLTSYHVVFNGHKDIETNFLSVRLRFNYFNYINKKDGEMEQVFQLDKTQPIVQFSTTENLDYALLKVEDKIRNARLLYLPYDLKSPIKNTGLYMLHHPEGEPMKISIHNNGIKDISKNRIQYVAESRCGSSGAPCFNDQWKVIAIHRSESSQGLTLRQEGVAFHAIYTEIRENLNSEDVV